MINKIIKILENHTEIMRQYEDADCYTIIPEGNFLEIAEELKKFINNLNKEVNE